MEGNIVTIAIAIASLIAGSVLTYLIYQAMMRKKSTTLIKEAEAEAEVIKKDKILQAKEKFLQLKAEHEKVINEKNQRILAAEGRLKQREAGVSQRIEEVQRKSREVDAIRENLSADRRQW